MNYLLENPTAFITTFIIPGALFLINAIVRSKSGKLQTSGAEVIFVLIAIDLKILSSTDAFAPLVKSPVLVQHISAFYVGFLLFDLLAWVSLLYYFEGELYLIDRNTPVLRTLKWLFSWVIVATLLCLHTVYFIYHK